MSNNEITVFTILISIGILVGSIGGVLTAKKGKDITLGIMISTAIAVFTPLVFWFIWTVTEAMSEYGHSFETAFLQGLRIVFLLAFLFPFLTGIPAIISTAISHFIVRRYCMTKIVE
jgi:hypothetical protein